MKKKTICGIILLMFTILPAVEALKIYDSITKLEIVLSPEHIGLIYREQQEQTLASLRTELYAMDLLIISIATVSLVLFCSSRKKTLLASVLIIAILLTGSINYAKASNLYFRPRMTSSRVANGISYVDAYATIVVSIKPRTSSFVAYMLAIGNPETEEFIEVGYAYDSSGAYLYSSKVENGVYSLQRFAGVNNGDTHYLHISYGYTTLVDIDSTWYSDIIFMDTSPLEFVVQGETPDGRNMMDGKFSSLTLYEQILNVEKASVSDSYSVPFGSGFPVSSSTLISEDPFHISPSTSGEYYTGAFINGGKPSSLISGSGSRHGGGYLTFSDGDI